MTPHPKARLRDILRRCEFFPGISTSGNCGPWPALIGTRRASLRNRLQLPRSTGNIDERATQPYPTGAIHRRGRNAGESTIDSVQTLPSDLERAPDLEATETQRLRRRALGLPLAITAALATGPRADALR